MLPMYLDVGYHNAEFKTPNLDNLVETGIELTNYHVHLDCSPTRVCYFYLYTT